MSTTIALNIVLALSLVLCACTGDDRGARDEVTAAEGRDSPAQQIGNALAGRAFRSIDRKETGLGPEGAVTGHWELRFSASGFEWMYSDVVESGTYVLDGTAVVASGTDRQIFGEYDVDTDILTWDGADYGALDSRE